MKSYFSRFLHHIMSHSGIKEVLTSSLSLSDLIGESRSNQVANLSNLDYRVKPDNDNIGVDHRVKFENDGLCTGRSMVEMLGVLAIIGVLSVGAIAGYSKAMFKYKLNKQAEGFSFLLNEAIKIKEEMSSRLLKHRENLSTELVGVLAKTNSIPDGFTYKLSMNSVYDTFQNPITFYCYATNTYAEYLMRYNLEHAGTTASARGVEICRNIVNTAKANAADLELLQMRAGKNDGGYDDAGIIMGDKKCRQGRKCLRDMSVKDMDDFCSSCTSETNCSLMIYMFLIV